MITKAEQNRKKQAQKKRRQRQRQNSQKRQQRLSKTRQNMQKKRQNQSLDDKARRLEMDKLAKQQARQQESKEKKERRLENVRKHQQKVRLQESQEKKEKRLEMNKRSKQQDRLQESKEKKERRLEMNRLTIRQARLQETQGEKDKRKDINRNYMRQRRNIESPVEKQERKIQINQMMRNNRNNKSPQAKQQRKNAQRVRIRRKRQTKIEIAIERIKQMGNNPEKYSCGLFTQRCIYCGALHFKEQKTTTGKYTICCRQGKIKVNRHQGNYPEFLKDLFLNPQNKNYLNFHNFIRQYNNSLAFVSFGAKYVGQVGRGQSSGKAPYCLRVDGQIYHNIANSIYTDIEMSPSYSQLYVLDSELANQIRLNHPANKEFYKLTLCQIEKHIRQNNEFAKSYMFLKEMEEEMIKFGEETQDLCLVFTIDPTKNQGRYNIPTVKEVAYVWQQSDGEPPEDYDMRCYLRQSENGKPVQLQNLHVTNPFIDPMTYPLFFINGGRGWTPELKYRQLNQPNRMSQGDQLKDDVQFEGQDIVQGVIPQDDQPIRRKRQRIPLRQYKRHEVRIVEQPRKENESVSDFVKRACVNFNPILFGGRLFCQFVIDSYLRIEGNDLNWIRANQQKLKAEEYSTLLDSIKKKHQGENAPQVGRTVVLPSSFQGSPRNMHERYIDAMAMVLRIGKPDLFITFTCNPQWPEIQNNLYPGQRAVDRPDLVSRVFKLYLNDFINTITKLQLFGKVKGYVYSIEFQKRSLPHSHCLFILDQESKFDIGSQDENELRERIDSIIKAEVPNEDEDKEAYDLCLQFMMHGPCGQTNTMAPCMLNGKCKRNFPKQFQQTTRIIENNYPSYRRRPDGRVFKETLKNCNVVPYNLFLLKRYRAHINVEVCTSVSAIKYIFKYIYKGFDCADLNISPEGEEQRVIHYDQVKNFQDARYVSGPQACWRLYEFGMHENSHTIYRLTVHEPDRKRIQYREGFEEQALDKAKLKPSTLEAFFELNKVDPNAHQYFYYQIPQHYTYIQSNGKWKRRSNAVGQKAIGRIYGISPLYKEKFYIRTLLLHQKGVKSFQDLRTVDGLICPTFQQACKELKLIENDDLNRQTLKEASQMNAASQVRNIFAILRVYNSMGDPQNLWEEFRKDLIEDYVFHQVPDKEAQFLAIENINNHIIALGGTQDYLLKGFNSDEQINMFIVHEYKKRTYEGSDEAERKKKKMEEMLDNIAKNPAQDEAFNKIIRAIEGQSNQKLFFLDGPAGTGKTYLYNALILYLEWNGKKVLAHATTGIASDLLIGGSTMHSRFKIPLNLDNNSVLAIKKGTVKGKEISEADLIIIDEASSMQKDALRCIDNLLRELMDSHELFGGKVILLGGDFRQTLPVVELGTPARVIGACIANYQTFFNNFQVLQLHENMRAAQQNSQFKDWLLRIGDKQEFDPELGEQFVKIPPEHLCEDIITDIYGLKFNPNDESISSKVIVAGKNIEVMALNNKILDRMDGKAKLYHAWNKISDTVEDHNSMSQLYNEEFLSSIEGYGLPPHKLRVKIGSIVMLIRNLNIKKGLCNGTRMQIMEMGTNIIKAKILTGREAGEVAFIPRIRLNPNERKFDFKMVRTQFPLLPAFAMTINKSQGQSFDKVGVALNVPVFSHGQLYVAFSRVRSKKGLRIFIKDGSNQGKIVEGKQDVYTINVVYKQVLDYNRQSNRQKMFGNPSRKDEDRKRRPDDQPSQEKTKFRPKTIH